MKFKVAKLKETQKEYNSLSKSQQTLLEDDYNIISTIGDKVMNKYVYVKDSEGFVTKKLAEKVEANEIIISKEEFEQISGIDYYKKTYGRGGARQGAGRKKQYTSKKRETFDLEEADIISLKEYAKKHKISKNKALHEAITYLTRQEA